jgi:hypothetical protein
MVLRQPYETMPAVFLPKELWIEVFEKLNPLEIVRLSNENARVAGLMGKSTRYWRSFSLPSQQTPIMNRGQTQQFETSLRESPFEILTMLVANLGVFTAAEMKELRHLQSCDFRDKVSVATLRDAYFGWTEARTAAFPDTDVVFTAMTEILRIALYDALVAEFVGNVGLLHIDEIHYGVKKLKSIAGYLAVDVQSCGYDPLVNALIEGLEDLFDSSFYPCGQEGLVVAQELIPTLRTGLAAGGWPRRRLESFNAIVAITIEHGDMCRDCWMMERLAKQSRVPLTHDTYYHALRTIMPRADLLRRDQCPNEPDVTVGSIDRCGRFLLDLARDHFATGNWACGMTVLDIVEDAGWESGTRLTRDAYELLLSETLEAAAAAVSLEHFAEGIEGLGTAERIIAKMQTLFVAA